MRLCRSLDFQGDGAPLGRAAWRPADAVVPSAFRSTNMKP